MTSGGTSSQGKKNKTVHVKCRRCGEASYHKTKKVCSSCGFGKSAKRRDYEWQEKAGE
ncbi:50S ribosomal protein L37e [Halococcus morrhuae DSM 1307]|jgi:large subunit ribosomal protein L37e|uniref:Large ribosomal subunit protein eL37 n=3 Tax=Halococcus TaxID=2249 RepID=M0M421_HALMO|nr:MULTISPECIES: 50S ribosomal protein L37e [Halococcus]EMA40451.1 50S ribosomal protein L37e [Halococcus morrhuae DSM 1307]EMA51630.1 50S ribosomal protein L37e [Halococcus thailandensis JCM 13552]UOO94870.1 50S ribosomal protein L37e [Halococcus dombrowskii]